LGFEVGSGKLSAIGDRLAIHRLPFSSSACGKSKMWQRLKQVSGLGQEDRSPNTLQLSWVIPGKLALGGLPRSSLPLTQGKIAAVLSLSHESEGTLPANFDGQFHLYRCPLPDSHWKEKLTPDRLAAAVEIVRQNVQNHQPLYVHCLAGIERSPTVCIAYLCRYDREQLRAIEQFLS
jgi:Dual specificity phosphatase, catalytic domain